MDFAGGRAVHFVTPPYSAETGFEAVELSMDVSDVHDSFICTAVVHDPLGPALDLLWFRFAGTKAGTYHLAFDFPDQVQLSGSQVWVTLTFDRNCTVAGSDGCAPEYGNTANGYTSGILKAFPIRKLSPSRHRECQHGRGTILRHGLRRGGG